MNMHAPSPETAKAIAKSLLEIEAIKLRPNDPFTWASGWKSPIYCDNRLSLSFPDTRKKITEELVQKVKENMPEAEAIAGVATAGIPQGALIAAELGLPFIYVRSSAKSHGMTNMIEGKVVKGQKVVVVEDLVSTGGSSLKAANDLKAAGLDVLGMVAIFTYDFPVAAENFEKEGIDLYYLSDYNFLIEEALETGYVSKDSLASLQEWRKSPGKWMK